MSKIIKSQYPGRCRCHRTPFAAGTKIHKVNGAWVPVFCTAPATPADAPITGADLDDERARVQAERFPGVEHANDEAGMAEAECDPACGLPFGHPHHPENAEHVLALEQAGPEEARELTRWCKAFGV